MDDFTSNPSSQTMQDLDRIYASNLPEIEKLAAGFARITDQVIAYGEAEIELLKASNDLEALVKQQIKVSTIKHARSIFEECYRRARQKAGSE